MNLHHLLDLTEQFLIDINKELKAYNLSLNHNKTSVQELPISLANSWIHQINEKTLYFQKFKDFVDYKELLAFLDFCILTMSRNKDNAAILNYGLKVISSYNLTKNAQRLLKKTLVSLSLIYPYIVPLLGDHIFAKYAASDEELNKYINLIYDEYLKKNNFEACTYAVYYAINHEIEINTIDVQTIIDKKDCLLLLMTAIYMQKNSNSKALTKLKDHAKKLMDDDYMDEYWIFIYECLAECKLKGEWKEYKKARVSFLKQEYKL